MKNKSNVILFIGNYLSKSRGSISFVESTLSKISSKNLIFHFSSKFEKKFFRLFDILLSSIFKKYNVIIIDIYSGLFFYLTLIIVIISFLRRKKIILFFRGGKLVELNKKRPKLFKVFRLSNEIYSPSNFIVNHFKNKKFNIIYLPNSIDTKSFKFKRKTKFENKILWVRAFDKIYNPKLAIKILYNLLNKNYRIHLTMIGPDLGELDSCKKLIDKLELKKNISILGPIEHSKLVNYYHESDIYLNTTSFESFGNTLCEAASSGTPIVSSSVGEIPYTWKDKHNIILSKKIDVENFSNAIVTLINNKDLRNAIILNAKKNIKKFDRTLVLNYWIKMLSKI